MELSGTKYGVATGSPSQIINDAFIHYRHRMATRNCLERVPDEDFTQQGRDDRRRSLQDGAHLKVEAPDLAVTNVDP
jgi:hypothetical protein